MEGPGSNGMQRQDSSTSLATVNIGGGPSSSDGAVGGLSFSGMPTTNNNSFQAGDDVVTTGATDDVRLTDSDVICLSGGSVTSGMTAPAAAAAVGEDAGSVADSASSLGAAGQVRHLRCGKWPQWAGVRPVLHVLSSCLLFRHHHQAPQVTHATN